MMEAVSVSVSKLEEAFHKHKNIVNGKQYRKASNEQFNKIFGSYIVEKKQKERIVKKGAQNVQDVITSISLLRIYCLLGWGHKADVYKRQARN